MMSHRRSLREHRPKHTSKMPEVRLSQPSTQQVQQTSKLYSGLSKVELCCYLAWTVVMWCLAIESLYKSSQDHSVSLAGHLTPGWQLLGGRLQDISDVEWKFWKKTVTTLFVALVAAYIVIMRFVEIFLPQMREVAWTAVCIVFLILLYNWQLIAILLFQSVVMFLASRTRLTPIVWLVAGIELCLLNSEAFTEYMRSYGYSRANIAIYYSANCIVKLISFSIECCDEDNLPTHPLTGRRQGSFFDLLSYTFYFPLFFCGPVVTYDQFRVHMNRPVQPLHKEKFSRCLSEFLRYTFWLLVAEISLHFLYFPAFLNVSNILRQESFFTVVGVAVCSLVFFQVKYLVLYGLPRAVALLDGVEAPLPPMCIFSIYTFKDMWRYFDRGLHLFLVRYIYIPIGGSKKGLLFNQLASLATFFFVFFWHGTERYIFYWAIFNVIGILMEKSKDLLGLSSLTQQLSNWLSGALYRRIICCGIVPLYIFLALANLIYVSETEAFWVQTDLLFISGNVPRLLLIGFSFYCNIQLAVEAHRIWGKTYLCSKAYYFQKPDKKTDRNTKLDD